jgi:hypothetical protein
MIRFRLDDQLIDELPLGWDDLTYSVKVDRTLLSTRLLTVDTRLRWYRDGYRYLKSVWNAAPACGEVLLRIEEDPHESGTWEVIYRGVIKLPAASWGYEPDQVEAPVEDDSFYAYLKNNKDLEVNVNLPQTKNGEPLAPLVAGAWTFRDPLGVQPDETRPAYLFGEVLRYLVDYLTDHRVKLAAPLFEAGGDYEGYVLQTGYRLRTGLDLYEPLTLTLQDVLVEAAKNWNLGAQLRFTGGVPLLYVDRLEAINSPVPTLRLEEVHPLTVQADTQRLYGSVRVGSDKTLDQSGALPFPEFVRWRGFAEEQYYLLGQCNLSAELDLVRSWVVSSNVLEQIVFNLDDAYDADVCLVQVDPATGFTANTNWLLASPGPVTYFNESLTNEQVVRRWLGGVPSSLASELGNVSTGRFRAAKTPAALQTNSITTPGNQLLNLSPASFDDDAAAPNFDEGNVWNTATDRWTAPVAGVYGFDVRLLVNLTVRISLAGFLDGLYRGAVRGYLKRYSAGNVLLNTYFSPYVAVSFDNVVNQYASTYHDVALNYSLGGSHDFACNATDYVVAGYEGYMDLFGTFGSFDYSLQPGSWLACTQTTNFGDFTQTVDAAANLNYLLRFRAPLTRPQLRAVLANPGGAVDVVVQGRRFRGWLEALNYDRSSNLTDFTLATSKNYLPQ